MDIAFVAGIIAIEASDAAKGQAPSASDIDIVHHACSHQDVGWQPAGRLTAADGQLVLFSAQLFSRGSGARFHVPEFY